MPRRKTAFELDHEGDQIDALMSTVGKKPQVDASLKKAINFKIIVDNHAWLVHSEFIVEKSKMFEMMLDSEFKVGCQCSHLLFLEHYLILISTKEAAEHVVDLKDDEPELIARAIMFCYWDQYPVSPNQAVHFGSPTVSQVMKENMIDETKEFEKPVEPKYDAVLHLEMYCVAEKMDMKELMSYARNKCWKALDYEQQGLWAVVEMLYEVVPDHLVEGLKDQLGRTALGMLNVFAILAETKFVEVEEAYPKFANRLSMLSRKQGFGGGTVAKYIKGEMGSVNRVLEKNTVW
jgi:hypothetical protein